MSVAYWHHAWTLAVLFTVPAVILAARHSALVRGWLLHLIDRDRWGTR